MGNEIKTVNEKRTAAINKIKVVIEELINDGELFCPHDIIIIQQGNIQVYSGEVSIRLPLLD
jgi:hypothetical protein